MALLIGRNLARHYLSSCLPIISLLIGVAVPGWAGQLARTRLQWLRAVSRNAIYIDLRRDRPVERASLVCRTAGSCMRRYYFACPLWNGFQIGQFIPEHSAPQEPHRCGPDRSRKSISTLKGTRSAGTYICTIWLNPSLLPHAMQEEFIHESETAKTGVSGSSSIRVLPG